MTWSRGQSDDAREGVSSFLEKRAAVYPNRVSVDFPDFEELLRDPEYK